MRALGPSWRLAAAVLDCEHLASGRSQSVARSDEILSQLPAVASTWFSLWVPVALARGRESYQLMADVEMTDESAAALPAELSKPMEVEVAVLEQEVATGAATEEQGAW